jgi:hypothetical protein
LETPHSLRKIGDGQIKDAHYRRKQSELGAITQQINTNNKLPQFLVDDLVSFRWKREPTISL